MERVVRWAPVEGEGLEHLTLRITGDGVLAESVVIGAEDGRPFGLHYRIRCDAGWRVREFRLTLMGRPDGLHLAADGNGHWTDAATGRPLPELAGCTDLDLSATPFTNTLPIRRLDLAPGGAATIRVVYVAATDLTVTPAEQRYTRLTDGSLYRYESLTSGFTADLPVDGMGLVMDYPGLFQRLV